MKATNPVNISDNEGYDNQPSFSPNGKSVLYARSVDGLTDIARYTISSGKTKMITETKQGGEYSPTTMPDGKRISSVRLDTTGFQRLYAYNKKGESEMLGSPLVVGYHAWINELEFVAFVLGDPNTMEIVHSVAGESRQIGQNIGRSLHKIPNSDRFSYVDKNVTPWEIKSMDPKTLQSETIVTVLEGAEDYCWTPSGEILMGKDGKLFFWLDGPEWKPVELEGEYEGITRLAVSPDGKKLAIVVNE